MEKQNFTLDVTDIQTIKALIRVANPEEMTQEEFGGVQALLKKINGWESSADNTQKLCW